MNTRSSGCVACGAGWPLRWRAAAMARRRTASGFRAGMPRPWWVSALRSDGQVVPQLLGGGVDAAQLLGQGEGAFGRGPVGRSGWAASPSAAGDAKACDRGHARDPRRSRRHVLAALAESALGRVSKARVSREMLRSWDEAT